MNKKEYEKMFDKTYKFLSEIHLIFYVWKSLQIKDYENIYKKNNSFWLAVLRSLEYSWLSKLSKIYEDSSYSKIDCKKDRQVLSIYLLVDFHYDKVRAKKVRQILDKNQSVLKNLKKLRQKDLAHNDIKHTMNPQKLLKKYPVKYIEIENLLKESGEILSNLHVEEKHGFLFDWADKQYQDDVKYFVKKIKYFDNQHKDHFEKFKKGLIDDPVFPYRGFYDE